MTDKGRILGFPGLGDWEQVGEEEEWEKKGKHFPWKAEVLQKEATPSL